MRDAYNEQLRTVLEKLMEMGGLVESMLELAVRALVENDFELFAEIERQESRVNDLQNEVDDECVRVTARQQPVAGDARFVFVASRAANDLERVGDQAVNVVQNARYVWQGLVRPKIPSDVPAMAQLVRTMLADALGSLVMRDVASAEKVFESEERADAYRDCIFRELLKQMITDPLSAQQSMSLVLISRNLERVGDHATNMAEEVIYLVRGHEIRHKFDRSKRRAIA